MTDGMTHPRRAELRVRSRAAFGQRYRLELMLAIRDVEDGLFTLTDLTRTLGVAMSSLQKPIEDMAAIGLVTALPTNESRFRYYTRNPSAGWDWALELARFGDETESV